MFALRLNEHAAADGIVFFGFGDHPPADLVFTGLDADNFVHDVLPGADGNHRITVPQINAGQAQVHGGLLSRLIHGHEQAGGFDFVLGLEGGEGFGGVVEGVIHAFATEEEAITRFHVHASSSLLGR